VENPQRDQWPIPGDEQELRMISLIDKIINKHLRSDEYDLPRLSRIKRWHWERVAYNRGPIFWTLSHVWCYRPFYWLWRLRCRNVSFRMRRVVEAELQRIRKEQNMKLPWPADKREGEEATQEQWLHMIKACDDEQLVYVIEHHFNQLADWLEAALQVPADQATIIDENLLAEQTAEETVAEHVPDVLDAAPPGVEIESS
jgi:hypothetical protein